MTGREHRRRAGVWARRGILALALLALGAPACAEERAPRASGEHAEDYFPLVEDARWVYEVRTAQGLLEVEVTAEGDMDLPGREGPVFVMEEHQLGPDLGFVRTAPVAYTVGDDYVARFSAVDYDDEGKLRLLGETPPTWVMPIDAPPGKSWGQETRMFASPEGGGAQIGWSGLVKERTSVEVPAGSYEDVLEIRTTYGDASKPDEGPKVIYHDYYARGVGLVRSVTEDPSGDESNRVEQVLVSVTFPR